MGDWIANWDGGRGRSREVGNLQRVPETLGEIEERAKPTKVGRGEVKYFEIAWWNFLIS